MSLHGEVHVWYMTPDQLAEYVKKHPVRPYKKEITGTFERNKREWQWPNSRKARSKVD